MAPAEMPIFTRTFDFLSWLLPETNNFPRAHRHRFLAALAVDGYRLGGGGPVAGVELGAACTWST